MMRLSAFVYKDPWIRLNPESCLQIFPYWSIKQTRKILNSLVSQGILITRVLNSDPQDRTKSYAFSKLALEGKL